MSQRSPRPPRGTRDRLPAEVVRRRYVTGVIERVYEAYGFVPLETPAVENLSTLLGKYGEEGDQLLFRVLLRRDALARALARQEVREADLADLGLRYDLTVPLARVVAAHPELPRYFKRYQIQPVWRADRPGRGRYREFYQCDVDAVGTTSLVAEAEVCAAVCQALARLGFADVVLRVNHRGLLTAITRVAGVPPEAEQTALVALDKLDKVGRDGVAAELRARGIDDAAAGRLLDLVGAGGEAPSLALLAKRVAADEGGRAAAAEIGEALELMAATPAGPRAAFHPELARGLGYYTGLIFELTVPDLAGSLGGGGRYDGLVGMFGKRSVPAVGCSLGLERILLVMEERGMYPDLAVGPDLLLCWLDDLGAAEALAVAHALRSQGLKVEVYPEPAKLKRQLAYAAAAGVDVVAIVGGEERAAGEVTLRHLPTRRQERAPLDGAAERVRALRQPPA